MAAQEHWRTLQRLAGILTNPEAAQGELFLASRELYDLFMFVSGIDPQGAGARDDLHLPQGKALAPAWAAHCVQDYQRTGAFLRGLLNAVRAARQRFPGHSIHVLYAGCGPFATLALPLIPLLDGQPVTFTLLEVSPVSVAYLQKTIAALGLSPWIRRIILADATGYQAEPAWPVHVLVGEMLQAGLREEPQVAAMRNLAPQLVAGGFLVPQCITVQLGLLHPGRNQDRMMGTGIDNEPVYQLLPPAFELSAAAILAMPATDFPEFEVDIPADRDPGFRQLALFTRLQVFEQERLDVWASALTQPLILLPLLPGQSVRKIGLRYQQGSHPGFQWRVIA